MKKIIIMVLFLIILGLFFINQNDKDILEIANSNEEVKSYIQGRNYNVEISKVTKEDTNKLPVIYKDINADYKILYDLKDFKLLVLIDNNKVVRVVPITAISL